MTFHWYIAIFHHHIFTSRHISYRHSVIPLCHIVVNTIIDYDAATAAGLSTSFLLADYWSAIVWYAIIRYLITLFAFRLSHTYYYYAYAITLYAFSLYCYYISEIATHATTLRHAVARLSLLTICHEPFLHYIYHLPYISISSLAIAGVIMIILLRLFVTMNIFIATLRCRFEFTSCHGYIYSAERALSSLSSFCHICYIYYITIADYHIAMPCQHY
jgi:hypothetical protein